jgi:DNA invertase Pin-like site-specific DNA recombinase
VNIIGYLRRSTGKQDTSIEAQRAAILSACERRGWAETDVRFIEETASGKNARRPGLEAARAALASGEASALVVHNIARLSRSLIDFVAIMEAAQSEGWILVALDAPIEFDSPMGRAVASIIAVFASLERELIGERTRQGLAVRRSEGVKLGRPRELPDEVRARIFTEREAGATLRTIAAALNAEGVPTAHGGKAWYASSVRAALNAKQ